MKTVLAIIVTLWQSRDITLSAQGRCIFSSNFHIRETEIVGGRQKCGKNAKGWKMHESWKKGIVKRNCLCCKENTQFLYSEKVTCATRCKNRYDVWLRNWESEEREKNIRFTWKMWKKYSSPSAKSNSHEEKLTRTKWTETKSCCLWGPNSQTWVTYRSLGSLHEQCLEESKEGSPHSPQKLEGQKICFPLVMTEKVWKRYFVFFFDPANQIWSLFLEQKEFFVVCFCVLLWC